MGAARDDRGLAMKIAESGQELVRHAQGFGDLFIRAAARYREGVVPAHHAFVLDLVTGILHQLREPVRLLHGHAAVPVAVDQQRRRQTLADVSDGRNLPGPILPRLILGCIGRSPQAGVSGHPLQRRQIDHGVVQHHGIGPAACDARLPLLQVGEECERRCQVSAGRITGGHDPLGINPESGRLPAPPVAKHPGNPPHNPQCGRTSPS